MYLKDGFPGQRLHVLPRPLITQALSRAPTSRLLVTDAGYFPYAARHGRIRPAGCAQAVVIMCVEGAGWCDLDGVRHPVHADQVLIIPPHVAHRYFAHPTRPWTIWWLHVTGADVADLLAAVGLTTDSPTGTMLDIFGIVDLAERVCDHLAADETAASLTAASGAAWHLLALLAAEREGRSSGVREPVQRVQEYLRAHLSSTPSVPALAKLAGFSTSHFSARFRAATGFSVTEYVKRLRMARARQLLITSEHSIAEIAADVGYQDPFYFSRQFHAVNGVSPRTFRAETQQHN